MLFGNTSKLYNGLKTICKILWFQKTEPIPFDKTHIIRRVKKMLNSKEVKEFAKGKGADLVGIAPIERFKNAPLKMSPQGLLPSANSVIVVGIHHPDVCVELGGEPTPHDMGPYGIQGSMNRLLDDISFLLARFLEKKGYETLPIAATNIWRYKGYKDLKVDFAPDMAHRYAAVAAGLGEIGWNGLLLTPQFGPRQRVVSIITEAKLVPTPMYSGKHLCDKCMECVKHCPTDAFRKEVKKVNKIEIGGKVYEFPDINKWRCAWAENFALSLDLKIPEKVNEDVILDTIEKYGVRGGEQGQCLKFCMIPDRRYYDLSYCRGPRRKKEKLNISSNKILAKIKEIIQKYSFDYLAIGKKKNFKDNPFVHPEFYLPDIESIISVGIKISPYNEEDTNFMNLLNSRKIGYIEQEIAHYLDIIGYSAVTDFRIFDNLIAKQLKIYQGSTYYGTVLTSAKLPEFIYRKKREIGIKSSKIEKRDLRKVCQEKGSDLVGFFSEKRFKEFRRNINKTELVPESYFIKDRGHSCGPYIPQVQYVNPKLEVMEDYLHGLSSSNRRTIPDKRIEVKSAIVIGLHFPYASLYTAKVIPTETVGPYAFAQYESLRLLADIALDVVKFIEDKEYHAAITYNFYEPASFVTSSRGILPDIRSIRFAVILAGLGYIADNGCPMTEKYGLCQRFICVVTDYPFSNDPLYQGEFACKNCNHPCIKACPMKAIEEKKIPFEIEGKEFIYPKINTMYCNWAKRYALNGEAGPAYYGVNMPLFPKGEITPEKVASAVSKVQWGVQKRHINICEECIRTCPFATR